MFVLFGISLICIIVWAFVCHFFMRNKITFKEAVFKVGGASIVSLAFLGIVFFQSTADTLILNGYITSKEKDKVNCSHSYQCRCRMKGTGDNRRRVCDTCYDHPYDFNWNVESTVGQFRIDRIDRQGKKEPPRWTAVTINEPASAVDTYTNYVLASPHTLFKMNKLEEDTIKYGKLIPEYPRPHDYYKMNRVLSMGVSYPEAQKLNSLLNDGLKTMGRQKQVNIIVITVNTAQPEYRFALERAWVGGKKNDVIIIFGMPNGQFEWVDTITFANNTGNEMLAVLMRDNIQELVKSQQFGSPQLLSKTILDTIQTNFHRKEMKDFEYLKGQYVPSNGLIIGYTVFMFSLLTGLTIFFYNFDLERGDWNRVPYVRIARRTYY